MLPRWVYGLSDTIDVHDQMLGMVLAMAHVCMVVGVRGETAASNSTGLLLLQAAYLSISESYRAALAGFLAEHPVHIPHLNLRPAAIKPQPCAQV